MRGCGDGAGQGVRKLGWLSLAILVLVGWAGAASATPILVNGSFENGANPGVLTALAPGSTAIDGWIVLGSGGVDYVGSYWTSSDGTRSVDLSALSPGGIAQTFATLPGHEYVVHFDLAGNPGGFSTEKVLQVSADGTTAQYVFDTRGHTRSSMGWVSESFTFVASGTSATLSFAAVSPGGGRGPAIDNVAVTVMPEPSTALLFALGVAGLGAAGRRRDRSAQTA